MAQWRRSCRHALGPSLAILDAEAIAVGKCVGEGFLVRDEDDPLHDALESLQLLDHYFLSLAIEGSESLIDDDALTASVVAGDLADGQRQAHRHSEPLAAAQEGDGDRLATARRTVHSHLVPRLVRAISTVIGIAAPKLQVQVAGGKSLKDVVRAFDNLPFGLPHEIELQPLLA